jgi:hypothetical protein
MSSTGNDAAADQLKLSAEAHIHGSYALSAIRRVDS